MVCQHLGGFYAFCHTVKEAFCELPSFRKAFTFHSVLIVELMEFCHLSR